MQLFVMNILVDLCRIHFVREEGTQGWSIPSSYYWERTTLKA
jgi:hypothetical protein